MSSRQSLKHDIHRRWQRGGTVTGVIVGLIIGLTIAVWVAMTIMKTPLPFVDKLGKQTQPAGELGDPNKTLPGGARERRERLEDDDTAPDPKPAAKAEKPVAPAVSSISNPPSDKPAAKADKTDKPASAAAAPGAASGTSPGTAATPAPTATASPAASTAPAAAGGEGFTYYLQAGAFREISDAESTKGKLALMGVAASIAERKSELGTLYRVRVGPFSEVEAMNRARVRLSDNGVDAAVVRVPK